MNRQVSRSFVSLGGHRHRSVAVAAGGRAKERHLCAMARNSWTRQASASATTSGTKAGDPPGTPPPTPESHLLPAVSKNSPSSSSAANLDAAPPAPSSSPAVPTTTAERIVQSLKEIIRVHGNEKEEVERHAEEKRQFHYGQILWYDEAKRFGFIEPIGLDMTAMSNHVFFHKSTMFEPLESGDLVEYSLEEPTKADFVRKVEPEPSEDVDVQFYRDFPDEYAWVEGFYPGKRPSNLGRRREFNW